MAENRKDVISSLDRIIGLIKTDTKDIPAAEKKRMVRETLDQFQNYVSPGWLKYRKSVSSDSAEGAVLEWQDGGAYCYGLEGEKFIDCLGGFAPRIPRQGDGRHHPGRPAVLLLHERRRRGRRDGAQALAHRDGRPLVHLRGRRLPREVHGRGLGMRQEHLPPALRPDGAAGAARPLRCRR